MYIILLHICFQFLNRKYQAHYENRKYRGLDKYNTSSFFQDKPVVYLENSFMVTDAFICYTLSLIYHIVYNFKKYLKM